MKSYTGAGVLNTLINKLPVELHLPGYEFCGPGTKLNKRLARGDKGVNLLDAGCKEHDMAYAGNKNLKMRHDADKALAETAMKRFQSKDASLGERINALGIAGIMKAKVKLGMGYKSKTVKKEIKKCVKCLQKSENLIKKALTEMHSCISILNETDSFPLMNKENKKCKKKQKNKMNDLTEEPSLMMNKNIKTKKRKIDDNDNGVIFKKQKQTEVYVENKGKIGKENRKKMIAFRKKVENKI